MSMLTDSIAVGTQVGQGRDRFGILALRVTMTARRSASAARVTY